ncbi:ATP-binding protein [Hydrogenovibrio halophilus]|uniref:ATP-binding protein n=1 Tax=Hydrogenovibrio halophilus TaxID=373391 RepID=UPI00036433A2|nr:ATP-binding protein [Hydrogenovibrio halophilus]
MSDFQDTLLDFAEDNALAGFRLHRLAVYNWGTFDHKVYTLNLNGQNSLLTGDIGSGKSTLVDAVTTLLVPAHKIAYNKAAGADSKERSLRSYVMGYFRSTRSDLGAKQEALRDANDYSVILGVFYNEGYDHWVSLAQVFWLKEGQNQPDKFFVVADQALSIVDDFSDFGKDISGLRKRFRARPLVELFDTYKAYAGAFRKRFGLKNEQALALFHQTVSMKQVGNLTDFVRQHMLEESQSTQKVDALIRHFDDLNQAHQLVLKAKHQVSLLEPMVADGQRHTQLQNEQAQWEAMREGLEGFFAEQKLALLQKREQSLQTDLTRTEAQVAQLERQKQAQQGRRDELKQAISDHGGDRLAALQKSIDEAREHKKKCQNKSEAYQTLLAEVDLTMPEDNVAFAQARQTISDLTEQTEQQQTELEAQQKELEFEFRRHKQSHDALDQEIQSLKQRKNNIDQAQIQIRQALCEALDLDENEMPFVGELLQVREEDQAWEGAIERILHNFALSLLVPDRHYTAVSDWVEQTRLKGRLVYYRIRQTQQSPGLVTLHPQSLARKVSIKPDSEFYDYLHGQLAKRFDYACCESLADFRREKQAVTLQGQVKSGGQRHEKDDRRALKDRRFYVLGWSNQDKIAALKTQADELEQTLKDQSSEIAQYSQRLETLNQQLKALTQLSHYQDFDELNWSHWARQLDQLMAEKAELEASHDQLTLLQRQLETLEDEIRHTDESRNERYGERGELKSKLETLAEDRQQTQAVLTQQRESERFHDALREALNQAQTDWQLQAQRVESIEPRQRAMRETIQSQIDKLRQKLERQHTRLVQMIQDFCHQYPAETKDFSADIAGLVEFEGLLNQLLADDLPRFEARFKEQLNQNTINQISHFKVQLKQAQLEIKERIEIINQSLADIDYNPGRFIRLELAPNPDPEIKAFYQELEACTENTLTGSQDEQYSEAKFLQVKALIDRFAGREGLVDLDKRWTAKVTDVRNFYQFSASERYREDDTEHEHYSDSAGKSGGQKEKLAYTVLAASLAYQFGLEWGEVKSRSFRFVVIDEAFGRGSDDSARFGLDLFQKLNLQLLIVTPKQKIHVIEPFVANVGFVTNRDGRESQLRNLTIEQHLEQKARFLNASSSASLQPEPTHLNTDK